MGHSVGCVAKWRDAVRLAAYGLFAGTVATAVGYRLPAPLAVKVGAAVLVSVAAGVIADPALALWRRLWRLMGPLRRARAGKRTRL